MKNGRAVPKLSRNGALAIAVPGEVAGLVEVLKRFGSLPLETVISPAMTHALKGFPIQPKLLRPDFFRWSAMAEAIHPS